MANKPNINPENIGAGLGVALKIEDGASRAAEIAMATILSRLSDLSPAERALLDGWQNKTLYNYAGVVIGEAGISAEAEHGPLSLENRDDGALRPSLRDSG